MINWFAKKKWKLEGWDTFARHAYPIKGSYPDRESAIRAARRELARIEKMQPTGTSGGQGGIQDQVYVVSPDGEKTRIRP